jgi:hypothetical protein
MRIDELTDQEQFVLVVLAKQVVWADREFSPVEGLHLRELANAVGKARWHDFAGRMRREVTDRDDISELVQGIDRPEAQKAIHTTLVKIAAADDIADEEREILSWVEQAWGLT